MNQTFCTECGGTGICGDEGPGRKNARYEWQPCDCPLGEPYRSYRELTPEAAEKYKSRAADLESALDMANDEFVRIISILSTSLEQEYSSEIVDICRRALLGIQRKVPLITECAKQSARIRELEDALNEIFHQTSTTSRQIEIIGLVTHPTPQKETA